MAIRLRRGGTGWRALCAAEYSAVPGDLYLDDAQAHAIREKLYADWRQEEGKDESWDKWFWKDWS